MIFCQNLSDVRLHVGPEPRYFGARAFAFGNNIFIDPMHYRPDTFAGKYLIGHETAHVVQQRTGSVPNFEKSDLAILDDPFWEIQANFFGYSYAVGKTPELAIGRSITNLRATTNIIQCDLVQNPSPSNFARLIEAQGSDPATAALGAIGYTTDPVNADPPEYKMEYTATQQSSVFAWLTVMRRGYQGENTSLYLQAGIYETNFSFSTEDFYQAGYPKGPGRYAMSGCLMPYQAGLNRVYFVIDQTMANLNRDAEREHCNDHIYALQQTLQRIEAALQAIAGKKHGPYPTKNAARQAVIDAVLNQVPAGQQNLGGNMNAWLQEYQRLCRKSADRDTNDYHTFGLHPINPAIALPAGNITYLTGAQRGNDQQVFLKVTQGQTQINQHQTNAIIV